MLQILNAWFLSQGALAAVLSDWFYVSVPTVGTFGGNICPYFEGEAHNLFGTICGILISDVEKYTSAAQYLTVASLCFALMIFVITLLRPDMRVFKMVMGLVAFGTSLAATVIWVTSDRVEVPGDEFISVGVGWCFELITTLFSLSTIVLNIFNIN
jgi:hypothetical protein